MHRIVKFSSCFRAVSLVLIFGVLTTVALAQQSDRVVRIARGSSQYPIRLTAVIVDGRGIVSNQPFTAGDDWLDHLQIVIHNQSHKKITSFRLSLSFPETGDGKTAPMAASQIQIGRMPAAFWASHVGANIADPHDPFELAPSQTITINLAPYKRQFQQAVNEIGHKQAVSSCWIDILEAFFDDDSKWSPGVFYKPSPSDKGRYIPSTAAEFNQDHKSEKQ